MTKYKLDRINASHSQTSEAKVRNQKTFSFTLFHVTWLQEGKYLVLSWKVTFEVNCQSCHISDINTCQVYPSNENGVHSNAKLRTKRHLKYFRKSTGKLAVYVRLAIHFLHLDPQSLSFRLGSILDNSNVI